MKTYIAERQLILEVIETGERRSLTVRIGQPYWDEERHVGRCPVEYIGLFDRLSDAVGADLIQALHLATDIDGMLEPQTNKYRFYYPDGQLYFE